MWCRSWKESGSIRGGSDRGSYRGDDISKELPTASSDAADESATRPSRADAYAVEGKGLQGDLLKTKASTGTSATTE